MMKLTHIKTLKGEKLSLSFPNYKAEDIHTELLALPALIDPHVHLRIPGAAYKEDWVSGAKAALAGGVTTVFDMPNNIPSCLTKASLSEKKQLINDQLDKAKIPLRYGLYFGASRKHLGEIEKVKNEIVGIKVFMASSTGDLLMSDPNELDELFKLAATHNLLIAAHAEDESLIQASKAKYGEVLDPSLHSQIRSREAAKKGVEKALELAIKHSTRLYLLHIGTKEELDLIKQAKRLSSKIFAETTPLHLFLSEEDYGHLGNKAVVNPPIRTKADQEALWEAIYDGTIDTIGTDHAPHTLEEKKQPYGQAPSGAPGLETRLPLLLNAYHEKKITLETIVKLTRTNIEQIFQLPPNDDIVLVDLNESRVVDDAKLHTKCRWSPFHGKQLKGWPHYTILKGELFHAKSAA